MYYRWHCAAIYEARSPALSWHCWVPNYIAIFIASDSEVHSHRLGVFFCTRSQVLQILISVNIAVLDTMPEAVQDLSDPNVEPLGNSTWRPAYSEQYQRWHLATLATNAYSLHIHRVPAYSLHIQ